MTAKPPVSTGAEHQQSGALGALLHPFREAVADALWVDDCAVAQAFRPALVGLLSQQHGPLLVVTARSSDALKLADSIGAYIGRSRVAVFPAWETLPYERLSPQPQLVGQRLSVLHRLGAGSGDSGLLEVIVAPIRAVLQPMDARLGNYHPLTLSTAWDGFDALITALAERGYRRVQRVETRGDFAVRGGIIDVFPVASDFACRIEFFGDEVEQLRQFTVGDQLSVQPLNDVRIDAAREIVIDDALCRAASDAIAVMPEHVELLEALARGDTFDGVESLAMMLRQSTVLLPTFMPANVQLVLVDPLLISQRAQRLAEESTLLVSSSWATTSGPPPPEYATPEELLTAMPIPAIRIAGVGATRVDGLTDIYGWESFRGDIAACASRASQLLREGIRVIVTTDSDGSARRISDVFGEYGLASTVVERVSEIGGHGRVEIVVSDLNQGFRALSHGVAVLGLFDVFGPRRVSSTRRLGSKRTAAQTVLTLAPGDPVVHRTHGVGRFVGMITREFDGLDHGVARRDYVVVEYAGNDTLYVPSDQIDALNRYQGGDTPALMSLGGAQWERAKTRVRAAVREMAAELIRLYAARMHAPGRAFAADGQMQAELEDAFAFVETPDQLQVADEVKRDMEAPIPMDRLISGDVGFGKTEVAVRAAGKAVFDGTQVVVLVPTTILVQQHLETFRNRFSGFPVNVAGLSRFSTAKERQAVKAGIADGTVDIVVGTHALLSPQITFKQLGLVIVDEEHRFGVRQKEQLKQLRTSVDVLSMSATPIPRTLEMAVSGIRDLSAIETPPEDRQPVLTLVEPFAETQVALAIRRELLRDGQVFYVHNQVESIYATAEALQELIPDARIGVAHGQLDERELERTMVRFWEYEFDVLVCTTIIESGVDIPNANTLIVERADMLGLAQLHQLRGRVGRSSQRGYAYLFFPGDGSLTETAHQRLQTIAENARLGSGLAIAMRDLEIRGAGNVVGAEQSGHVSLVGFDMYATLLKEEIAKLAGGSVTVETELKVDLPVDAHLPEGYVGDANLRLELYQRIALIRDATHVTAVRDELRDRFGPLPAPAERLIALAAVRAALRRWNVEELAVTARGELRIAPVELRDSAEIRVSRTFPKARIRQQNRELFLPVPSPPPDDLVAWVAKSLRTVFAG